MVARRRGQVAHLPQDSRNIINFTKCFSRERARGRAPLRLKTRQFCSFCLLWLKASPMGAAALHQKRQHAGKLQAPTCCGDPLQQAVGLHCRCPHRHDPTHRSMQTLPRPTPLPQPPPPASADWSSVSCCHCYACAGYFPQCVAVTLRCEAQSRQRVTLAVSFHVFTVGFSGVHVAMRKRLGFWRVLGFLLMRRVFCYRRFDSRVLLRIAMRLLRF